MTHYLTLVAPDTKIGVKTAKRKNLGLHILYMKFLFSREKDWFFNWDILNKFLLSRTYATDNIELTTMHFSNSTTETYDVFYDLQMQ